MPDATSQALGPENVPLVCGTGRDTPLRSEPAVRFQGQRSRPGSIGHYEPWLENKAGVPPDRVQRAE